LPRIAKKNLHEEDVFVAVVAKHIVVDLCNDSISVLPVEAANVAGVDFVLVFNGGDEAGD